MKEIYTKYPPYSFIWPYSFNWHLRVGTYLSLVPLIQHILLCEYRYYMIFWYYYKFFGYFIFFLFSLLYVSLVLFLLSIADLKNCNDFLFIIFIFKDWPLKRLLRLANLQPFLAIFCQLHKHLSQNLGADGHFEGLNVSKSQLNQFYDINYKCPWQVCFSILEEKTPKIYVSKMAIFQPFVVNFLATT